MGSTQSTWGYNNMGGGLMQLVAYGAQDVYLTGQPQITYFKVVYRRHTNFSVEPIQQTFQGNAEFGRTITCNVNRNGDLITNMYLVAKIKQPKRTNWGWVNKLGYAMIENIKVEVGGSKIDEQYGDWLNVWNELTRNNSQDRANDAMIGNVNALTSMTADKSEDEYTLYVPLQFWFNRNNGLALPLIALQYHDIRVSLKLRCADELVNNTGTTLSSDVTDDLMKDAYLLIDYIYLDAEERKRFAQAAHEYLIEQVQFTGDETWNSTSAKYRLNFNHPSKYLVWNTCASKYQDKGKFIDWAFDGDWKAAKDRAAKKIFLATREKIEGTSGGTYSISFDDSTIEIGDVAKEEPGLTGTVLKGLLAKIDAQLLFAGSALDANATLENVVVLRNELTDADMATLVSALTTSSGISAEGKEFLEANQVTVRDYFNYSTSANCTGNPVTKAKLQLNGHDRFSERDGNYFNYVQPYQHFSNTPCDGINVYSFALKPEDHQPSGTCNFSRIDNTTLNLNLVSGLTGAVKIYCVNYNVFRVMSGMGGLAYSN